MVLCAVLPLVEASTDAWHEAQMQLTKSGRAGAGACCSRWCAAHERSPPAEGLLQHKLRGLQQLPDVDRQPVLLSGHTTTSPMPSILCFTAGHLPLSNFSSYDIGKIAGSDGCNDAMYRLLVQVCPECADNESQSTWHTYNAEHERTLRARH